jgi:hypothetical protein
MEVSAALVEESREHFLKIRVFWVVEGRSEREECSVAGYVMVVGHWVLLEKVH